MHLSNHHQHKLENIVKTPDQKFPPRTSQSIPLPLQPISDFHHFCPFLNLRFIYIAVCTDNHFFKKIDELRVHCMKVSKFIYPFC